jgi:ferredoxin-like protein FixX
VGRKDEQEHFLADGPKQRVLFQPPECMNCKLAGILCRISFTTVGLGCIEMSHSKIGCDDADRIQLIRGGRGVAGRWAFVTVLTNFHVARSANVLKRWKVALFVRNI